LLEVRIGLDVAYPKRAPKLLVVRPQTSFNVHFVYNVCVGPTQINL